MRPNYVCCFGGTHAGGVLSCVIAFKCPEVRVTLLDNKKIISDWIDGNLPFNEPGLDQLLRKCRNRNLFFSSDYAATVRDADLIFICCQDSMKPLKTDLSDVKDKELEEMAKTITAYAESDKIIVEKSLYCVKAAENISEILKLNGQHGVQYYVLSNPDILTEGSAINELLHPEGVMIGCQKNPSNRAAAESLSELYEMWVPRKSIAIVNYWTAEISKLAKISFLAQKIASVNTLAMICEQTEGDITEVLEILKKEPRVNMTHVRASLGFGELQTGLMNLILRCETLGLPEIAKYWETVLDVNTFQTSRFIEKIKSVFPSLEEKDVAIFGFSCKKNSADVTDSPAIDVCKWLLREKSNVTIYDPAVRASQLEKVLKINITKGPASNINICNNLNLVDYAVSAIIICTDWDEFRTLDYRKIKYLKEKPVIFDGHNLFDKNYFRTLGTEYHMVGLPSKKPLRRVDSETEK